MKLIFCQANISAKGTYQELQASTLDFAKLLETSEETSNECDDTAVIKNSLNSNTHSQLDSCHGISSNFKSKQTGDSKVSKENEKNCSSVNIPRYVYVSYFSASGSICKVIFFFCLFVFTQLMITGGDYWLSFWY